MFGLVITTVKAAEADRAESVRLFVETIYKLRQDVLNIIDRSNWIMQR